MRALAINCGSSSLKYALFDVQGDRETCVVRAAVGGIGQGQGQGPADHAAATKLMLEELRRAGTAAPDVIGHRIVHGGPGRSSPELVDSALVASLRDLVPFAPLHLPPEIRAIEAAAASFPQCPQVACFDTAFHRTMPAVAERYALPDELFAAGVRRYGFHGLSYEYVVAAVGAHVLGRAVLAHLGAGASMAAVRDGRAVDTTMGFTPSGGLVMATRAGDLDPGLSVHLVARGYDARALDDLVNRRAGMLALSGATGDVRELLASRERDPRAALALDVFAWSARKWVGAMAATLGGIDSLVFTGGIGENAPTVREAIAAGLDHLGLRLDKERNLRGDPIISADASPCTVRVVRTDEERMVARHAARLVSRR